MASFSDEHEDESEEVVVDVVLSSRHEMAPFLGAAAKNLLLNRLDAYVAELKSVYSSGSLLPRIVLLRHPSPQLQIWTWELKTKRKIRSPRVCSGT